MVKKLLQNGNGKRFASAGIGALLANFVVALLVDQLRVPLHPNVVATGTIALATSINILVSKYN
jgi:hypothetical protein